MARSMLDIAYDALKNSKEPLSFKDLVAAVAKENGLSEEETKKKLAQFYTNLSIDGRFVVLSDNFWDLRERVPFAKAHIDMNEAYNDPEEEESDEIEKELGLGEDEPNDSNENFDDQDIEADRKAEAVKEELGV